MSMHPVLTTTVYIGIAVIFATFVISMIVYTRAHEDQQGHHGREGRLPVDKEEGILLATRKNEGRSGTP